MERREVLCQYKCSDLRREVRLVLLKRFCFREDDPMVFWRRKVELYRVII